ncbi:hypothetical protein EDC96DRAFT_575793 [Choanephora cucurbitarum]|nr:hypothetical protein EDC96DRAFT_575793 [Choanephora cucurbitarum]
MCSDTDVERCFYQYKTDALELLRSGESMFDVEDLLTISKTSKLMKSCFGSQILSSFRNEQEQLYKVIKDTFSGDLRVEVEESLDEFAKEKDLIIKFVNNLIDNVTVTDVSVFESMLTSSFVHDAMKTIFKHGLHTLPHLSNHTNDEGAWRPDYKVARLNSAGRAQQICFGEVKPLSCNDKAKKDKDVVKVAKYIKDAIYKFNYSFMLSYVVLCCTSKPF